MKKKEKKIGVTHIKPDMDGVIATTIYQKYGTVEWAGFIFIDSASTEPATFGGAETNLVWIDRGHTDLDHHGIPGVTSSDLAARACGVEGAEWIRPVLETVQMTDLKGQHKPFDMDDFMKCQARDEALSDNERMEIGMKMGIAVLEFHEKGLKRDNEFTRQVIQEFGQSKTMTPRLGGYCQALGNPEFGYPCDLGEILTALQLREGEEAAKEFGKFLLKLTYKDVDLALQAEEELKQARKIRVGNLLIVAQVSDNPKLKDVAMRKLGAVAVIKKTSAGNVQIFFNRGYIKGHKDRADFIIAFLRQREAKLAKTPLPTRNNIFEYLSKPEDIPEIPEWYYFVREDIACLNGSSTTMRPPTKISFSEIIGIVKQAFSS